MTQPPPKAQHPPEYAWEGLPVCKHGFQFDCYQCKIDDGTVFKEYIEVVKECAQEVYSVLGSGHSEAVYESALDVELLSKPSPRHRRQVPCTVTYKGYTVGTCIMDILIGEDLVVEVKAVDKLTNKDELQLRKYLRATGLESGLVVNFGKELAFIEVYTASNEEGFIDPGHFTYPKKD